MNEQRRAITNVGTNITSNITTISVDTLRYIYGSSFRLLGCLLVTAAAAPSQDQGGHCCGLRS